MTCLEWLLGIGANFAAIITAIIAVWFWYRERNERAEKQSRLENYLKQEKEEGSDKGQRGLIHLIAKVGMSESDIMDAAFRSKLIKRVTDKGEDGFATKVMLEYIGK